MERLEKLAGLKAKGFISEDEFNSEKAEILKPQSAPHPGEVPHVSPASVVPDIQGTYWFPIPALVLGIICMLALLDDSDWDADTVSGMILFGGVGLALGIVAIKRQKKGLGMAIAGVVMCSLALVVTVFH